MNARNEVNAAEYVAPGTSTRVFLTIAIGAIIGVILTLTTMGVVLLIAGLGWIVTWWRARFFRAVLHGSAIKVSSNQLPDIYQSVVTLSERLGLRAVPEVYVYDGTEQNAYAAKHGSKDHIILVDDIVYGALRTKNRKVIDFIIGHELAHIALGHTKALRGWARTVNRKLSRLDEFSCDAVANALVGDATAGRDALALLTIGPQLFQVLNRESLEQQVNEVVNDKKSRKSEAILTHPLILRRYARIAGLPVKL